MGNQAKQTRENRTITVDFKDEATVTTIYTTGDSPRWRGEWTASKTMDFKEKRRMVCA